MTSPPDGPTQESGWGDDVLVDRRPLHSPAQIGVADIAPGIEILCHQAGSEDVLRYRVASVLVDGWVDMILTGQGQPDFGPVSRSLAVLGLEPYPSGRWNPTNYVTRAPAWPRPAAAAGRSRKPQPGDVVCNGGTRSPSTAADAPLWQQIEAEQERPRWAYDPGECGDLVPFVLLTTSSDGEEWEERWSRGDLPPVLAYVLIGGQPVAGEPDDEQIAAAMAAYTGSKPAVDDVALWGPRWREAIRVVDELRGLVRQVDVDAGDNR